MNSKVKNIFMSFNYTIVANIFSLLSTGLITLIIPKIFSEVQYGYWQLYIFYSTYVGFFHLGLQDGIYLRYGGQHYSKLDKKLMHSQLFVLFGIQFVEAIIILFITLVSSSDINKKTILVYFVVMMLLYLPNTHLLYILQMTMRIKEYCINIIIEKSIYLILVFSVVLLGKYQYQWLMSADIIAKGGGLLYTCYVCRDIVFQKGTKLYHTVKEAFLNISVGIKLLLANIGSMLITGIARFAIERTWDITVFGSVSLVLSLCNFFLIFVTAIGQVIFPILKRANEEILPSLYNNLIYLMTFFLLVITIIYQPFKNILGFWLPQYQDTIVYFAYLIPMCVAECKVSMVINTYYKALRMEQSLLKINFLMVVFSIIYTYFSAVRLLNLDFTILGITIVSLLRCVLLEYFLSKTLHTDSKRIILSEIIVMSSFILINTIISNSIIAFLFYGMILGVYWKVEQKNLVQSMRYLISFTKDGEENLTL